MSISNFLRLRHLDGKFGISNKSLSEWSVKIQVVCDQCVDDLINVRDEAWSIGFYLNLGLLSAPESGGLVWADGWKLSTSSCGLMPVSIYVRFNIVCFMKEKKKKKEIIEIGCLRMSIIYNTKSKPQHTAFFIFFRTVSLENLDWGSCSYFFLRGIWPSIRIWNGCSIKKTKGNVPLYG